MNDPVNGIADAPSPDGRQAPELKPLSQQLLPEQHRKDCGEDDQNADKQPAAPCQHGKRRTGIPHIGQVQHTIHHRHNAAQADMRHDQILHDLVQRDHTDGKQPQSKI